VKGERKEVYNVGEAYKTGREDGKLRTLSLDLLNSRLVLFIDSTFLLELVFLVFLFGIALELSSSVWWRGRERISRRWRGSDRRI
jgi:hypothetical protein